MEKKKNLPGQFPAGWEEPVTREPLLMGSDVSRISKGLKQHSCYFSGVQLWKLVGEPFKQNDGWVPILTAVLKGALQRPNTHQ